MIYENPILSGSVQISGSLYVGGLRLLSSSNQIATEISGAIDIVSSSLSTRVSSQENFSSSFASSLTYGLDYIPNTYFTESSTASKTIGGEVYAYMYTTLGFHWGSTGYSGAETGTTSLVIGGIVNEYLDSNTTSGAALPGQNRYIPIAELTTPMKNKITTVGRLDSSVYYLKESDVQLYHTGSVPRKYVENSDIVVSLANTASLSYTASISITATTASNAILASAVHNNNLQSGSIKFWQGRQSEYDLISSSADNNTIYFITE